MSSLAKFEPTQDLASTAGSSQETNLLTAKASPEFDAAAVASFFSGQQQRESSQMSDALTLAKWTNAASQALTRTTLAEAWLSSARIRQNELKKAVEQLLSTAAVEHPRYRVQRQQEWEGTITEISSEEFVARLRDLTVRGRPDEVATFGLDQISDADRKLVAVGAVFYWNVGYRIEAYGQKSLHSTIRLRRLPIWTHSELQDVAIAASKYDVLLPK